MIPAFSNEYVGGKALVGNLPWTSVVNGAVSSGTSTTYASYVRRTGHTSNPVVRINGIMPWRDPSNYRRFASLYAYAPENLTRISTGATIKGFRSISIPNVLVLAGHTSEGVFIDGQGEVSIDPNLQNRANVECLLKMKDEKVNVGTALAEARTTVDMLASVTTDLLLLLKAAKSGRWQEVRRKLASRSKDITKSKDIANGYLQWKYGWKPLAADIYGLFKEAQTSLLPPLVIDAKKTIVSNSSFTTPINVIQGWDEGQGDVQFRNTCHVHAKLSNSFLAGAQSHGLLNPLSVAWEIIPYSFVIDWVCPVGNFLEALTAHAGLDFVGGYTHQVGEAELRVSKVVPSGWFGIPLSLTRRSFDFQRQKLGNFPQALPYVKSPFSTGNVMSAVALFRQLFK
jgi:hypothetical protein